MMWVLMDLRGERGEKASSPKLSLKAVTGAPAPLSSPATSGGASVAKLYYSVAHKHLT